MLSGEWFFHVPRLNPAHRWPHRWEPKVSRPTKGPRTNKAFGAAMTSAEQADVVCSKVSLLRMRASQLPSSSISQPASGKALSVFCSLTARAVWALRVAVLEKNSHDSEPRDRCGLLRRIVEGKRYRALVFGQAMLLALTPWRCLPSGYVV